MKLLIENFKQLADSIGKSNTTVPSLQTADFSESNNFILPVKYAQRILREIPNCSQLLEPTSGNIELVSENIQNTDALRLSGNENKLNRNRNALASQNTGNKRPLVAINKYPEKQTNFSRPPVVPGTKLFSEASLPSKGQRNILIFTGSISKGIRIRELNLTLNTGQKKEVSFPGATSKKVLQYLDVHPTNFSPDVIILHVGVNHLLEDNSKSNIENLEKNLRSMVEKCQTYGVKNVFTSGLVYITRIGTPVLEMTHEMTVQCISVTN